MIKVMVIFGTRPEAIKLAPVINALEGSSEHDVVVCSTGQHREMLDQVIRIFELRVDHRLNVMVNDQSLSALTSQLITKLDDVVRKEKPDWVVVQGDTTTCFAGALVGFYHHVKVAHVEAGLRTHNIDSPFPEEANRQLVSRLAALHCAPTQRSKNALLEEGSDERNIIVTGNTVIDALLWVMKRVNWEDDWRIKLGTAADVVTNQGNFVLITAHRRESHGQGMLNICSAIKSLAQQYPFWDFVYPVHLNPKVQEPVYQHLTGIKNIHLIEPLEYLPFIYLMKNCKIVLTDSGGIQEEAPAFGKPVLVMREATERTEGVDAGTALLIGVDQDNIINNVSRLIGNPEEYNKMAHAVNPYGDGMAANRIVAALR